MENKWGTVLHFYRNLEVSGRQPGANIEYSDNYVGEENM